MSKVSGLSPRENPFERGTTRGTNDVDYPQSIEGSPLKEFVCNICGHRTYTVDGKCGNKNDNWHKIMRAITGRDE